MKQSHPLLHRSIITPVLLMILNTIYMIEALKLAPLFKKSAVSESFFPFLCSVTMYLLCLKLLFDGVKKIRSEHTSGEESWPFKKPVILAVITTLFIIVFAYLGFLIAAPLYVFFFMLFFDDKPQQYVRKALYAIAIAAVVYGLFEVVFEVRFPELWR